MEARAIDGVALIFQLALDSEAPSEILIYLPQSHVLDVAEAPTSRRHGARGESLAQYLNAALDQFGVDAQVLIAQHTWPVWGNERVRAH